MNELSSFTKSGFKEWIASRSSFIKSTHLVPGKDLPDGEKVAVEKGARLLARQTGRRNEFLLVADAVLDGQKLPANLTHIHHEHWAPVPPKASTAATLTEARLINARWQFAKWDEPPLSTSMHFARDGRIKGHFSAREKFWNLENGDLHILTESGKLSLLLRLQTEIDGRLRLVGLSQLAGNHDAYVLDELPAAAAAAAKPVVVAEAAAEPADGKKDDTVKLIIWDLDDTFWQGTLAEGGITPIQAHIDFIKTISARGIVNSICSKNEFERTKAELQKLGIWEYFIFPRIDFAPKGAMIRDIIEAAQLRTPSVLFIDDNSININEALHYNPGLQTCLPDAIAGLLADPRCKGKPDPGLTRLERYKVLETKSADRATAGADNLDFLRNSEVRISFHHEIGDEFPRIHDLVNRTNQLNFTKKRWPEDEAEAKAVFLQEQELNNQNFHSHWGYVKVADKYGSYGICGFYLVRQSGAYHFLFSCRSLNMGIEQFVWQKIGRPHVKIVGEVVAALGDEPDWITVVDDADTAPAGTAAAAQKTNICVHGACDLAMMTHYLRMRYDMIEEFAFPFQDWEIHPVARAAAVYDEVSTPAGQALLKKMPGMPPRRFESSIHTGESDVYILSFSSELFCALYESKSTGIVLPLNYYPFSRRDFNDFTYQDVRKKVPNTPLSEADWKFMQDEFKLLGEFDLQILAQDVEAIFKKLRGKIVIVLNLSTKIGNNKWVLGKFNRINEVVQPLVQAYGFDTIDLGALIRDENDLVNPKDGGVHFKREIYRKMAEQVTTIIEKRQAEAAAAQTAIAPPVAVEDAALSPAAALISQFESLGGGSPDRGGWGFGCEFGLLQRWHKLEPLGLLRWASIGIEDLTRALETDFADLDDPSQIRITKMSGWDWGFVHEGYKMRVDHSNLFIKKYTEEEARAHFERNLKFLRRKLLEDLATGEKIFVYRVVFYRAKREAIARLAAAVARHGPSVLLYVQREDDQHPAFTVDCVTPNLMMGYIDRFAPTGTDIKANYDGWERLCRVALEARQAALAAPAQDAA